MREDNRSRQQGLTLVELLITIIIAGIVFAALVPVFVSAAQKSASDNARTVGLGVAQDKMERIRSLAYDDALLDNFNDGAFASNYGLGNHAAVSNGNGAKDYLVQYQLTYVYDPDSTAPEEPGYELYKKVTVDVYWAGNPSPVKHTLLRTAIYQQYAGPVIFNVTVGPRDAVIGSTTEGMIVPGSDGLVTITAYVETGVATREVRFTVAAGNGSYKKAFTQPAGVGGVYVWQWPALASGAPDGFFTITATAVSPGGYLGNTWNVTERLETGPALAPRNLTATAGNASVALSWEAPATGDIAYYEVWRWTTADRNQAMLIATNLKATSYPDPPQAALVNGQRYYYWVYAVDLVGNQSDAATKDAMPVHTVGDDSPPTPPSILTATVQAASVNLTWSASLDASGLARYEIFRSTDGTNYAYLTKTGSSSTAYSDLVGADSPQYYYKLRAVDASANANRSSFSGPVGPLKTAVSTDTLTVANDRTAANQPCTVTVQDTLTGLYYAQLGGVPSGTPGPVVSISSKGGSAQWQLPSGKSYTVTARYAKDGNIPIVQSAPPWTLSFK